ncbi:MAG: DUF58 domain-containing protein [Acidimicrobiales bacterium]
MRLTPTGVGTLAGSILLVAVGLPSGLAPLVALGVAGILVVCLAWLVVIEAPRVGVTRRASPGEVDRGSPAVVSLELTGASRHRPRPFTAIESVGGEQRSAALPAIPPGDIVPLTYELDTSRRGTIVAGPLVLLRADPFGLVTARRSVGGTCAVAVRPRRHHLRMLPSGRLRDLEGPTRELSQGTASFHQLREYVPGDDLRHIHWRTTARTGDLAVKQLVDTTRPEVVVILDTRLDATAEADDFESAVDIAASIIHAAETDGFPTQLLFTDGHNDSGTDGLPLPHLARLTDVARTTGDSMDEMAQALRGRGRSLVFITGELSAPDLHLVGSVARRFAPAYLISVVRHRAAPFVSPPGVIGVPCSDAEAFVAEWSAMR